ncbi:MAG: energy-coupling factor ABC transporter ATP-binding protein [Candidatus Methanomethylicia archaeon]|nr:energy-coupling factor ABC transporter ATP-binding protein [Candidatus Methanomethylicia archaeon]MDW7988763.1 ABC transporter ATP-binding protein [Nitrososphaerota archaeon]
MRIIEVRNLSYRYPESSKFVLENISLTINKGEFVVITGPSGCGKTTLCRCFNGLIPHFYGGEFIGEVIVNGLPVKNTPTKILSQYVGMVFQDPESQLFSLSVEREIAFGLENLGLERDEIVSRVNEIIELMNINHLRNRAPYELSGGEQQKVALAACLAMRPKIVVLDEPTSHLDPASAISLVNLLNYLKNKLNLTIVIVEHRLDLLAPISDRFIIMNNGKVIFDGDRKSVFSLSNFNTIRSIGIGIPKIINLYYELLNHGLMLPDIPFTSKMLKEYLLEASKI